MRAITVIPGRQGSIALTDMPEPPADDGPIVVQTQAIGICGTDLEIINGEYGSAPPGQDRLIIGHESLGRVGEAAPETGFAPGDLVVGIVRRRDPVPCPACAAGHWDMCMNGRYIERGIKDRHGYASERYRIHPEYLVAVDPALGVLGVLLEPATVVAKAWDHIEKIGRRAAWAPEKVLVTGAGPIGLLAALLATQRGYQTFMPNASAALVSIEYGARAGAYTPVSACSSGAEALALGARLIRSAEADVVIAGGTEAAITPITVAGFAQATALSRYRGDPASASRPFAADRDGFVLGEGAGVVVLESAEHAAARGARVHAVLAGWGIAADAHHITAPAPDGAGQAAAMCKALAQAGSSPADVSHVNAHATGTPVGDAAEARAILGLFGSRVPVTAPKASLGHLFGAAGAVEAVIAILSIGNDVVPPTRNLDHAAIGPDIGLDIVTAPRWAPQRAVLSNSFGFGGQNVSLLFVP